MNFHDREGRGYPETFEARYARAKSHRSRMEDLECTVHLPVHTQARGTVIHFHAGAFLHGTRHAPGHDLMAQAITRRGYAAVFPSYRLKSDKSCLGRTKPHVRMLRHEAMALRPDVRRVFIGPAAMGALEDGAALIEWWSEARRRFGISSPETQLWGSSAGGILSLNLLYLSSLLGIDVSDCRAAAIFSGGFLYGLDRAETDVPVYALHNRSDTSVPVDSIASLARRAGSGVTLQTGPRHRHGSPKLRPRESYEGAVDRIFSAVNGGEGM